MVNLIYKTRTGKLRRRTAKLRVEKLKDGHYHFLIHKVKAEEGIVMSILNLGGEFSWREAQENNYVIDIPLKKLREIWCGDLSHGSFHMQISDNGKKIEYEQCLGRRARFRRSRAKCMAQLLVEEYGSVDAFMEENNLIFEPGSVQEEIYHQVRSGQRDYFKDIEKKLMGE